MNIYQTILEKAEAITPEMIACRRDFHKYAETGWRCAQPPSLQKD